MIYRVVEGRRRVSHTSILHPLLQLLILELGGIERCWIYHKGRRIEHVGIGVVEGTVEGRAIVVLDGSGVVHPGGHVCKVKWQPICMAIRLSAIAMQSQASIKGLRAQLEMAKHAARAFAMGSRDAPAGQWRSGLRETINTSKGSIKRRRTTRAIAARGDHEMTNSSRWNEIGGSYLLRRAMRCRY